MSKFSDNLTEELDNILVKNGVHNNPAVLYDIAVYILERDKKILTDELAKAIEESEEV